MAKKTRAQLETEIRLLKSAKRSEGFVALGREMIRWGGLCFIAWCASSAIAELSGKETSASVYIDFLGTVNVSLALSWTVAIIGTAYGIQQRKLRRDTVERIQQRNIQLEKLIDPDRSSSKLTPRGETRPEDQS